MRIFNSTTRSIAYRQTVSLPCAGARSRHLPANAPAVSGSLSGRELRRLVAEMLD